MAFPALFMLSTALSAGGQLMSAMGAKKTSEVNAAQTEFGGRLNAFNIETEREVAQAQALQAHTDRVEAYNMNLSANIAQFIAQGRDVGGDRSVEAFLRKQQQTAGEDISRADIMAQLTQNKLTGDAIAARAEGVQRAASIRAQGRAQAMSATIGAFTTIIGGIHKYNQIRV
jgi:hypothetical protein